MRAISLVNRIDFQFTGNVPRHAIALGDVDNDGFNELVVGNEIGEVFVFKGRHKFQVISNLSFVSCIGVGDVLNEKRNCLVIISADGWCYIFDSPAKDINESESSTVEDIDRVDGQVLGGESSETPSGESSSHLRMQQAVGINHKHLVCTHKQRIPANAKNILLGDVDGDGSIEMVLGLTDRVVRSYRWSPNTNKTNCVINYAEPSPLNITEKMSGKLVALNKWECANQIGTISLNHTLEGSPFLLIAQPGGTFMRIRCQTDDISTVMDNLELSSNSSASGSGTIPGSSIDYQTLGLSRMRNQNISTEILGDFKGANNTLRRNGCDVQKSELSNIPKSRPYALATLDGTIMFVQDEVILWAIAVDHQIFALSKLDITGNGTDDIVACSWDGQTYILDQDKNCVRFQLDESVQAFDCGLYHIDNNEKSVTCLVYVTFKNTIILYYDIPLKELNIKKFEPDLSGLVDNLVATGKTDEEAKGIVNHMDIKTRNKVVNYLLYNVNS